MKPERIYPRMIINLSAIRQNASRVVEICHSKGIELVGVTKLSLGNPLIAKSMRAAGVDKIGESRLKNIENLYHAGIPGPFQLLRIPMLSEIPKAIRLVDEFLVSMPQVALEIDRCAKELDKNVNIIYMIDVGDLREGVWFENAVEEILSTVGNLKHAILRGIGTNLGCYGGVLPTKENMGLLVEIKKTLESRLGYELIVSGGSTVTLKMLEDNTLPDGINQFRVGEGIILGTDATGDRDIPYLRQDTVILEAEVVEVDYKPSVPVGEIGKDAFGRTPLFEDRGLRKRIILAIGEQDVKPDGLIPFEQGLKVLHASSDHLIVDTTESDKEFRPGDIVRFRMSYGCALRAFTSPYVEKVFIED
ncbi:Predicted amino acid racemase [Fervidobacterium changbaicum]|uniref:Alanine/ornithine racemase family PLP-dependent enzyme n=2 Tax=Fervidobacterium TaxID=2422 RepID=A0AAI8CLF8_FERIS|nr:MULTISPECIES: alanine/ornithine racemase family PLP-dependent enzyme [Fervidobacterium]AMW32501.1 alanine/ornithine racemase family PLP-dependent enzyme [Fervidobacterium islandicum]QAV32657.1 alanine/ornithine racemase family PLP-dependent enzyme [Fervidobacterium changbaicum]SDH43009.1 Predicted amino acid racemase [Fervidobacterium changbaicum]